MPASTDISQALQIQYLQHNQPTDQYLFISDLHLCDSRPHITSVFLAFLQRIATQANALFILGDLFEYWAGDDDIASAFHQSIISAFRALADAGIPIYLMHGNRDFLISHIFCAQAQITLLDDPTMFELHGNHVLLSHGDALCTDDLDYQAFRNQVRKLAWQKSFLSLPLGLRKQQIEAIRLQSEQAKSQKSVMIMDVNQEALHQLLRATDYPALFIHGHTHRPNQHYIELDGYRITRWVLGDWYEQGSFLAFTQHGMRSQLL